MKRLQSWLRSLLPSGRQQAQAVQEAQRRQAAVAEERLKGTIAAYRSALSVLLTAQLLLWATMAGAGPKAQTLWLAALALVPSGLALWWLSRLAWGRRDDSRPWELLLLLVPLSLDGGLLLHALLSLLHQLMPSYPPVILRVIIPLFLLAGVMLGSADGTAYGVCLWRRIPPVLCLFLVWRGISARGVDRLFPLLGEGIPATLGLAAGGLGALWMLSLLAAVPPGADVPGSEVSLTRVERFPMVGKCPTPQAPSSEGAPAERVRVPPKANHLPHCRKSDTSLTRGGDGRAPSVRLRLTAPSKEGAFIGKGFGSQPPLQREPFGGSSRRPSLQKRAGGISYALVPLLLLCAYGLALCCTAPWTVTGGQPLGARLLWLGRSSSRVMVSSLGALMWLLLCMLGWCMAIFSAGRLVRRVFPTLKSSWWVPPAAALPGLVLIWLCPMQLPGFVVALLPWRALPWAAAVIICGWKKIRKARKAKYTKHLTE